MMYTATIDHDFDDDTPVTGCGCDWQGTVGEVADIGDCSLTPGDASPVGRCPECGSLVYVDTPEARAGDEASAMVKSLRELTAWAARTGIADSDPPEYINAMAILSRIDGEPKPAVRDDACGQCEGTGTISGGLSGDGDDEECPVCDGSGKLPDDAVTCAHCGEERQDFTEQGVWLCGACNGLNPE